MTSNFWVNSTQKYTNIKLASKTLTKYVVVDPKNEITSMSFTAVDLKQSIFQFFGQFFCLVFSSCVFFKSYKCVKFKRNNITFCSQYSQKIYKKWQKNQTLIIFSVFVTNGNSDISPLPKKRCLLTENGLTNMKMI